MADKPSEKAIQRMRVFVEKFTQKSGTYVSPVEGVTEQVILGLAQNIDEVGRPLCPCRFYPDKNEDPHSLDGFLARLVCHVIIPSGTVAVNHLDR